MIPVIFMLLSCLSFHALAADLLFRNRQLAVIIQEQDGSYAIKDAESDRPVLRSVVGVQVDHRWIRSKDFPRHQIQPTEFKDELGTGQQVTVSFTGLTNWPELIYVLRLYELLPFGTIQVAVRNRTGKAATIQSIRSVQAIGEHPLDLKGHDSADRILSETFSEDVQPQRIYDLGHSTEQVYLGVDNQLIYNRESQQSLFFGALSAERFVTAMRLGVQGVATTASINSYTVDSTGTTEILLAAEESNFRHAFSESHIHLSLPLSPGKLMSSERLLFSVGRNYFAQLEAYGAVIRKLQHARVSVYPGSLLGWGGQKNYDPDVTEGYVRTNAQWLSQHLKSLGFQYIHIDNGYQYARGDWMAPNVKTFPHGMRALGQELTGLGLKVSGFVVPFRVSRESWIYQRHKSWLVRNAHGDPLALGSNRQEFVLDVTNPGAQKYLRHTYLTMARDWGWQYINLDGMENTAVEGYRYRPNTTAIEALRIFLKIVRQSVGDELVLKKDGSPMLATVGFVDVGRISIDTFHNFRTTKDAEIGVAGHYYAHRNFWVNDADCINVGRQVRPMDASPVGGALPPPLSLGEAQVSIVLGALSGGSYELGDDLPTLGADPERLGLVINPNLLQMFKLGRAAKPLDLLTYRPEDEQPSIFLLREDDRQSMLAVFNWTDNAKSHEFELERDLGLTGASSLHLYDALDQDQPIASDGLRLKLRDQPPHSVRLIKIVDASRPATAPTLNVRAPDHGKLLEDLQFSAGATANGVPSIDYHWDFGDGITADGPLQTHAYTLPGAYKVKLIAAGVDGVPAERIFPVSIDGLIEIRAP
jgi:alpha-galactosidase